MTAKNSELQSPSEATIDVMVAPPDANPLGTLFGGTLMSWIDTAASVCASRYARMAVVTAAVDALQFRQPIKIGWIVTTKAKVNYVSNTSCEVGVRVTAEDPHQGLSFHAASAYLTMVAVGDDGKPCALPRLLVKSRDEKRRYRAAETRRALRLALQRRAEKETQS